MYDNRIISGSIYNVSSIYSITATDNKLNKRSNTNTPSSPKKKKPASDSLNDTSHNSLNDDSTLLNELDNKLRLQSEENARLVQSKFNHDTLNNSDSDSNSNSNSNSNNSIAETEFYNKLSQAMNIEVDTSTLSKKIKLLNSLRDESNN